MNALESNSKSESNFNFASVTISTELIINENEKEKEEFSAKESSPGTQETHYIIENNADQEKEAAQVKEIEERTVAPEEYQLQSNEEAQPALEKQQENPLKVDENNSHCKEIQTTPISLLEHSSGKKEDNRQREREERPLVLEERHSLSIAETKKRRASVYCDENLFIPRELARSELHQRRFSTTVNNFDRNSKNSDHRLRMLKFPVGSGRARFVAQQLKRRKLKEQRMRSEEKRKLLEHKVNKSQLKEEVQHMPNSNLEPLASDEECCIILEEIVETEEDGTDDLIERVSKRQLKRSSSLDLSRSSAKELLTGKQEMPLFRWHNPDCSDSSRKMGLLKDISLSASVDIQVGYSEVAGTTNEPTAQQQQQQQVVVEVLPVMPAELLAQQQSSPRSCAVVVEQTQQLAEVQHFEAQRLQQPQQQQQQHQHHQPHVTPAPTRSPATTAATAVSSNDLEPLRQQLMHRIILPRLHTEELQQPSNVNNNAVNLMNQNLQQHRADNLGTSDMLQEWTQLHYDKYALALTTQQHHQQHRQQHRPQQQLPLWQHQQQQSYQMSQQEQQHLEAGREELQQLNTQYQRLKCQEEEKLKYLNNTLKEVYADRLLSERQHADYHRLFMHKMVESKKQEESLHAQKDQLKRQLKEDLDSLEQRIAEKQRELQGRSRAWQWQQQQQQQQHNHQPHQYYHQHQEQQHHQQPQLHLQQQQQQHLHLTYSQQQQQHQHQQQQQHQYFLRQLQPPPYQPRLQCFQDAFSHYAEPPLIGANKTLMPPPPPATTATQLQPLSVSHRTEIRQPTTCSGRIMRRRHTIDHRSNNRTSHPPYGIPAAPPREAHRRTNATAATAANFPRRDTSTTREANERSHMNQAIEQTAITSIISNYVTNYLNDMESRNT